MRAENAIFNQVQRLMYSDSFDDYKAEVEVKLDAKDEENTLRKDVVKPVAQNRQAKRTEAQKIAKAMKDFRIRQSHLETSCQMHDLQSRRVEQKQLAQERLAESKAAGCARSNAIAEIRSFHDVQRKMRTTDDRERTRQQRDKQDAAEEEIAEQRRQHAREQRELSNYMRSARSAFDERPDTDNEESGFTTCQNTLQAIRDVADAARSRFLTVQEASTHHVASIEAGSSEGLDEVKPFGDSCNDIDAYVDEDGFSFDQDDLALIAEEAARIAQNIEPHVPRLFPQFAALPPLAAAIAPVLPRNPSTSSINSDKAPTDLQVVVSNDAHSGEGIGRKQAECIALPRLQTEASEGKCTPRRIDSREGTEWKFVGLSAATRQHAAGHEVGPPFTARLRRKPPQGLLETLRHIDTHGVLTARARMGVSH